MASRKSILDNQHFIPITHQCNKCGKTKVDTQFYVIVAKGKLHNIAKRCRDCFHRYDKTKIRIEIKQNFDEYFKSKRNETMIN